MILKRTIIVQRLVTRKPPEKLTDHPQRTHLNTSTIQQHLVELVPIPYLSFPFSNQFALCREFATEVTLLRSFAVELEASRNGKFVAVEKLMQFHPRVAKTTGGMTATVSLQIELNFNVCTGILSFHFHGRVLNYSRVCVCRRAINYTMQREDDGGERGEGAQRKGWTLGAEWIIAWCRYGVSSLWVDYAGFCVWTFKGRFFLFL